MKNPFKLSDEAENELYLLYDKHIETLPKKEDGTLDKSKINFSQNKIDAMRHSYVSGVFTMEFSENTADMFGRLNELAPYISQGRDSKDINMDLWNNAVGRKYGKKSKTRKELFDYLHKAMKDGELILDLKDERKYKGPESIKKKPKSLVIVIEESKTGENLTFYDIDQKTILSKEEFVSQINQGLYPDYSVKNINGKETPVSKRDRFNFNNLG